MRPRRPFPACRPETRRCARSERLTLAIVAAWLARWRHLNLRVSQVLSSHRPGSSALQVWTQDALICLALPPEADMSQCNSRCPLRARSRRKFTPSTRFPHSPPITNASVRAHGVYDPSFSDPATRPVLVLTMCGCWHSGHVTLSYESRSLASESLQPWTKNPVFGHL